MKTPLAGPAPLVRTATLALLATALACDPSVTDPSATTEEPVPRGSGEVDRPRTPLDEDPGDLPVARAHAGPVILFEREIAVSSAPGPDGIPGTPDDLRFDDSWTGPLLFGFPSPPGDLWEAVGIRFQLIDGGTAFTNSGACLGSQRPAPAFNWSGGIRTSFLDARRRSVKASAVSIEVVNPPVTLRAYDEDGVLLATESLGPFRDFLTVQGVGPIAYVELTGEFWCIASRIRWNPVVEVDIDVKPGSDRNPINLGAAQGVVPVAILTTPDFDAAEVDVATVRFEGAPETHVDRRSGEPRRHHEDVDGDGDLDLVIHVRVGETDLDAGSSTGTLQGRTLDGTPIFGSDRVTPVAGGPPR